MHRKYCFGDLAKFNKLESRDFYVLLSQFSINPWASVII